jgi:hypothetical protein
MLIYLLEICLQLDLEVMDVPNSIKYFEWLFLGSLVLGVAVSAITYEANVQMSNPLFVAIIQFFVIAIILLLVLLTSRKKSGIAKWILIIFMAIGVILYIPQLSSFFEQGIAGMISFSQLTMQCIALYLLFTPESRRWFDKKSQTMNRNVEVSGTLPMVAPERVQSAVPDKIKIALSNGHRLEISGDYDVDVIVRLVREDLKQAGLIREVFTFVDASHLVSRLSTWSDRDKAKDRWHCVLRYPYERVFSKRNNRMRYRSQAKARFQVAMAALVHNLKRLMKPEIEHVPLKATR